MINKLFFSVVLLMCATCYAGNCDYSWQSESIGRNCGERSKYTDYSSQRSNDYIYQQQREWERQQRELERQQREQERAIERQQREAERQQREWEREQRQQQRQWENQQNNYSYPSPYFHY
ncbi:MAG: hypothetical protein IJR46_04975 [Neisseriaceae bacterium]|nr:hypothetical protein [Neisseriaceae bacterium]